MVKREPGYDPQRGAWEYVCVDLPLHGDANVERGQIASCIDCHRRAAEKDWLFRTYLTFALDGGD